MERSIVAFPDDDYAQSANGLFHFMPKIEYLQDALQKRALVPRYCMENLEYLGLEADGVPFDRALVLQKCFCDIPFHKLMEPFKLELVENASPPLSDAERVRLEKQNTHPGCYGKYAIAFSKKWGENNKLQPIRYINPNSDFIAAFKILFSSMWSLEDIPDGYSDDILNRLSFMKPLRGIMDRSFKRDSGESITIKIHKNFHDEKEWRYVPNAHYLSDMHLECIVANPNILRIPDFQQNTNSKLLTSEYSGLWLNFNYDDVRYIIVPDANARIEIIDFILQLPESQFNTEESAQRVKLILISKILVLDEVGKDW